MFKFLVFILAFSQSAHAFEVDSCSIDDSLTLSYATASTVPVLDGSKNVVSSIITSAELDYLLGVTSNIQSQLDGKEPSFNSGNLTDAGTDGITVTGGTGAVIGSGTSLAQHVADTTHNGYLSSTDWNHFNSGGGSGSVTSVSIVSANGLSGTVSNPTTNASITLSTTVTGVLQGNGTAISTAPVSNLTDAGTDGITVTGGSNSVLGTGTSLSQHVADATHNGYLLNTDWSLFNGKQAAGNYVTALTGDGTASGPGSVPFTLATVNSNVGSFGGATAVGGFTVNGKGLITAASSTPIQIAESQVTNLVSDLAGKQPTGNYITALTGDVTASGPGSSAATIAANVVTNSKLAQATAYTVKGNNTSSTANVADNQTLMLGTPGYTDTGVLFQITGNTNSYQQGVLQNLSAGSSASTDFIISNDQGTASTHYGDLGINSSTFSGSGSLNIAGATYLYSQTGDLVLGTNTSNALHFFTNGSTTDSMTISSAGAVALPGLTASQPVLTDSSKNLVSGTLSGNTTKLVTTTGTLPSGDCLKIDASGNAIDSGLPCVTANQNIVSITLGLDGGGSTITTGIKSDVYVPYSGTIQSVTLLADQSGSIVVDIWKAAYASFPPTVANTITASALPTITSAVKNQNTTLTGWTTTINAGDTLRFNVNSATSITKLNMVLKIMKN